MAARCSVSSACEVRMERAIAAGKHRYLLRGRVGGRVGERCEGEWGAQVTALHHHYHHHNYYYHHDYYYHHHDYYYHYYYYEYQLISLTRAVMVRKGAAAAAPVAAACMVWGRLASILKTAVSRLSMTKSTSANLPRASQARSSSRQRRGGRRVGGAHRQSSSRHRRAYGHTHEASPTTPPTR